MPLGVPTKRAVRYEKLQSDVLLSIGDTSSSLGLISTLVFGMAVTIALEVQVIGNEGMVMFMCLATSFSTYTTTFSLLEYYYAHTVKALDDYLEAEEETSPCASKEASDIQPVAQTDPLVRSHGDLMKTALDGFARLNPMRQAAKNSTWGAIISILAATISRIADNEDEEHLPRAWKSLYVCCSVLLYTAVCYAGGFASTDVKAYIVLSTAGAIASFCVAHFVDEDYDLPKIMSCSFLGLGVVAVTMVVRTFRSEFMPIIKQHAKIY